MGDSYYGIAKTGAVLNPLSILLTTDELGYSVTDAGARIVIASADKAGQLRELRAAGALDHLVLWGTAEAEGATPLDDWLSHCGAAFDMRARQPSDLAVIAYTSGTTGRPKGAMQRARRCPGCRYRSDVRAHGTGPYRQRAAALSRLRQLRHECGDAGRFDADHAAALQRGRHA